MDACFHHQNTRETAQAIKGMHIRKANKYLRDVIVKHQCVPFRRYNGGVGRCAQVSSLRVWLKNHVCYTERNRSGVGLKVAMMTILGHLWIKDETNLLIWAASVDKLVDVEGKNTSNLLLFFRPNSSAGLRDAGPRRVPSSSSTCWRTLRATLSSRYVTGGFMELLVASVPVWSEVRL